MCLEILVHAFNKTPCSATKTSVGLSLLSYSGKSITLFFWLLIYCLEVPLGNKDYGICVEYIFFRPHEQQPTHIHKKKSNNLDTCIVQIQLIDSFPTMCATSKRTFGKHSVKDHHVCFNQKKKKKKKHAT